jgi:hypothetical protein
MLDSTFLENDSPTFFSIFPEGGGRPARVSASHPRTGATVVSELAAVAGKLPAPAARDGRRQRNRSPRAVRMADRPRVGRPAGRPWRGSARSEVGVRDGASRAWVAAAGTGRARRKKVDVGFC